MKAFDPSIWKNLVILGYVCVELLALSSLLIIHASIVSHLIFMSLSISMYFLTALTPPGYYLGSGQPDPNLTNSSPKSYKSVLKIVDEDKPNQSILGAKRSSKCSGESPEHKDEQKPKTDSDASSLSYHSSDFTQGNTERLEEISVTNNQRNRRTTSNNPPKLGNSLMDSARFKRVVSAEQNNRLNRSEGVKNNPKFSEGKSTALSQTSSNRQGNYVELVEEVPVMAVTKRKPAMHIKQDEIIESQQKTAKTVKLSAPFIAAESKQIDMNEEERNQRDLRCPNMITEMQLIRRICRICQITQPLRVRHCHDCQKCVTTFDHHCPWMNNCIGEKNRPFFTLYLLFQCFQLTAFCYEMFSYDSSSFLGGLANSNKNEALIFGIVASILLLMSVYLLCFQLYIIAINLSTWEYLRWEKIEYLSIFNRRRLKSPFNLGVAKNFAQFFKSVTESHRKIWEKQLCPNLNDHLLPFAKLDQGTDTDRRLAKEYAKQ